jgi:hypothetical protein
MAHDDRFFVEFVLARNGGLSIVDAVAEADRRCGRTSSVSGDLLIRANIIGSLLDEWNMAATPGQKRAIRAQIRTRVDMLYAQDFCSEHVTMVHMEVQRTCARRRNHQTWSSKKGAFYEGVQKWIMKTGCDQCPIQKRV